MAATGKCNLTCADSSACGGMRGAISAYTYQSQSTLGMTIAVRDSLDNDASANVLQTREV